MDITWYGHSCFRLVERGKASVVTDPYDDDIGYRLPKLRADVVTVSHDAPGHANLKGWGRSTRLITRPGEYEIGGVFIIGVAMHNPKKKDVRPNIAFLFDFDGLTIAHLGDLDYVPSQSEVDALGAVNIALVPVGGGMALSAAQAAEVISLIEPDVVVPMHYKTPLTTLNLEPVERFLKVMGISKVQPEEALRISAHSSAEQTQVVLLEAQQ